MNERDAVDRVSQARVEVEGAELGDARLDARLQRIVEAVARKPTASLPKAMEDDAALEATYRFLGNERITAEAILAPHVRQTVTRCQRRERCLIVFDTTELRYGGEREGLGHLRGDVGRGMLAHVGLAVSADGLRDPMGVLHLETVVRRAPPKRKTARGTSTTSESLRWNRGMEAVHALLPDAICVMDSEADVFALIAEAEARGQKYVVRSAQNRATEEGLLRDVIADAPLVSRRAVAVTERRKSRGKHGTTRFGARSAHIAQLQVHARATMLRSPNSTKDTSAAKRATSTPANVVRVLESEPPEGDAAIEWLLLTNLPIDTTENVDFVVDTYRARWTIEDYFKCLKSGCAMEERQLESVRSVTNMLALSLPIAWLILRLRNVSRDRPDAPSDDLLPPTMMKCLRVLYRRRRRKDLPPQMTCKELTWAVAALGGHIKNNGEPGIIVLGRGLADLIAAADVVEAMRQAGEM